MKEDILNTFLSIFGKPEILLRSPGRVNIIGEHTDYNNGLSLPFAIEQSIYFCGRKNGEKTINIHAFNLNESCKICIQNIKFSSEGWQRYFVNSLVVLPALEYGVDIVFGGDLPRGAGVSSSSAITCGFIEIINQLFDFHKTQDEIIALASLAENGIGLEGGKMDQTTIVKGQKNHALLLDFSVDTLVKISMDIGNYQFYIFESGQRHDLVNTEYNVRKATCHSALQKIRSADREVNNFRDVKRIHLTAASLSPIEIKRCLHVIGENERVQYAVECLRSNNMKKLGSLLLESHHSLSQLYEVSTFEIDQLISLCAHHSKIQGARIMGGGFGGVIIVLANDRLLSSDVETLSKDYKSMTGLQIHSIEVNSSDGMQTDFF